VADHISSVMAPHSTTTDQPRRPGIETAIEVEVFHRQREASTTAVARTAPARREVEGQANRFW
jgi:hypothetical protein